jgi:hypothetical protein
MATLVSPGVDVEIIDESFYIPGNQACLPLIFIATADHKVAPDGTPAEGTYESGVIRTVTSITQSLSLYGVPRFLQDASGNQFHGDARNEYGLDGLNKFLEIGDRAYVVRANVNLNDSITFLRSLWTTEIQNSGDLLNQLIADYITAYNSENNFIPADTGYKATVTSAELLVLMNEALADTLKLYSFSSDAFEVAFIQDHTIAQPGYQDVLFDTSGGFLQLTDITGLTEDTTVYGAHVQITSGTGTHTFDLFFQGKDVVTFGQLVNKINTAIGAAGTCELLNGRLRITSSLTGVTSAVDILADGPSGLKPLFSSLNLFQNIASPIAGVGVHTLNVYDSTYTTIVGTYDGLTALVQNWTSGSVIPNQFTANEAEGLLIAAAAEFDNTKEFLTYTSLGSNDAARRTAIVKQLQAIINDPNTGVTADWLNYNIIACPGYFETTDEMLRLCQEMLEEVFVLGETPFDKPPTGPNGIVAWAATPARTTSYDIAYWYPHGISSNIDGTDIMTSASSTALRVFAYNDEVAEEWWAPAGTQRGQCPHLTDIGYVSGVLGGPTTFVENFIGKGDRDALYADPIKINPISFIAGRGILVMGQKTTYASTSALDRINVSRLVKFIKRQLRQALFSFLFEPNDQITRDLVKAAADGFLSTLIDRRGLYDFASICDTSNNNPTTIDNNELILDIAIKPVKAVEFIYVNVRVVTTAADIGSRAVVEGLVNSGQSTKPA